MKRIILVGNGFDKAHGIESSYGDFVKNYFYEKIISLSKIYNRTDSFDDNLVTIKVEQNENTTGANLDEFLKKDDIFRQISNGRISYKTQNNKGTYNFTASIKIKSNFFKKIYNNVTSRWVDIENEYFAYLNSHVNSVVKDERGVEGINNDFLEIRNNLIEYLKEQQKEISPSVELLKTMYTKEVNDYYFLSFNYTNTLQAYCDILKEENNKIKTDFNYIHGNLSGTNGEPIFGIGDEYDKRYESFKNRDNFKELLKFSKSQWYLRTENYSNLVKFIDEGKDFEIYIYGHSCGSSDKTLLRYIFEHENCKSIKVFYYQNKDNFYELMLDISQIFTQPLMFRKKVRSLSVCELMPQPKEEKVLLSKQNPIVN